MKYLAVSIFLLSAVLVVAQGPVAARTASSPSPVSSADAASSLDSVLAEIQQVTQSANADIARLHIDRWKGDPAEKAQLQQLADSLHKNITHAVPDLLNDVRSGHGSVSSTFRLYHDVNVVFEYLNSLSDAASSMGKKDESEPLNTDANDLDKARQHLSTYIERAAASLEDKLQTAAAAAAAAAATPLPEAPPKKIVVDDDTSKKKPATAKKKKTAAPPPQPSSTPN